MWKEKVAILAWGLQFQLVVPFTVSPWLSTQADGITSSSSRGNGCRLSMAKGAQLPTLEQLSKDPFMKQVSHAGILVELLGDKSSDQEQLQEMLLCQLGHSDGRGFFVSYLTSDLSPAGQATVPLPLQLAMAKVDPKELVPLACMNVVMPTAMISMHENPDLSEESKKASDRGTRILASLMGVPLVQEAKQSLRWRQTGRSMEEM